MFLNFNYLSMKMNFEEFSIGKNGILKPARNSARTTDFSALEKALLATLYLYLKVYIVISYLKRNNFVWIFHIFEDSSDLENLPLEVK